MKFKPLKVQLSIFLLATAGIFGTYAQSNSLYDAFDETVGKNNLGINNGTIHINNLRSVNDTHRYYGTGKYLSGSVIYDGQPYANLSLKYDLLKDILIAKIDGDNNNLGINLIAQKTESFSLDGKKFINLNYNSIAKPKFVTGFYQEDRIDNKFVLYTKYHKENVEVLRNDGVFYRFEPSIDYLFCYKNKYYRLASQRDLIDVFPNLEKNITDYYASNTALEKENENLFLKNLLKSLGNSIPNETN